MRVERREQTLREREIAGHEFTLARDERERQ
jgi:hypothetical protein